jgi:NDP-sugar pyrophosphorylase family protein
MNLTYVPDKPGVKGTGTALLNAEDFIKNRRMIIYYTDIITNVNLSKMLAFHENHKKWATLLLSKGWQIRVGTAETDDQDNITKFVEKPVLSLMVNTGISILEPCVFDYLKSFNPEKSIDLSKDIFPYFVQNSNIMAYIQEDCFWEDIGSIERYERIDHARITELMK